MEAASALVAETGTAGQLSMRAVAAKIGVAATSVYLHFAGIDELKVAVAQRSFAELAAARNATIAEIEDPADALVARCLAYVHFGLAHPGHYRLMFGSELSATVFTRAYEAEDSASRSAYDALIEAIRRCQQTGAARDDADPVRLAALLWPALHGQVSLRIDRPQFLRPPLDEVITQTVQRLVGLTPIRSLNTLPPGV
ncbi:MAG: TetR/AcrR family transcriptional regulator [Chloroflexota bacterium]